MTNTKQPDILGRDWDKAEKQATRDLVEMQITENAPADLQTRFEEKSQGRKPNEKGSRHEDREPAESGRDRHLAAKRDHLHAAVVEVAACGKYVGNPQTAFGAKRAPKL